MFTNDKLFTIQRLLFGDSTVPFLTWSIIADNYSLPPGTFHPVGPSTSDLEKNNKVRYKTLTEN